MGLLKSIMNLLNPENEACSTEIPGRNETCWCGSGKKYKKCHLASDEEKARKNYSVNCGTT